MEFQGSGAPLSASGLAEAFELLALGAAEIWRGGPPLHIRVGINSGDVVLRPIQTSQEHDEYTPIGHSMSLAARMEAVAPIGSVMVTDHIFS
jgi:class 3 adenylate cyclase